MGIWFLLISVMLPMLMIYLGNLFLRRGKNDTRGMIRYRTSRSTMNQLTWKYAHKVCGKTWLCLGRILLVGMLPFSTLAFYCNEEVAGHMLSAILTIETMLLLGVVVFTEKALERYIRHYGW